LGEERRRARTEDETHRIALESCGEALVGFEVVLLGSVEPRDIERDKGSAREDISTKREAS